MALTRPRYSQIYDTDWKQSVEVATVGSDVGNLFAGNLQPNTLDSVSLGIGNRILVKDQTNGAQNGLYVVRSVGTGSDGWWVRTLDTAQSSFVTSGLTVVVAQGTENAGQEFRLITPDPITLNTTSLTFLRISGVPGGANTQVQFNNLSTLAGSPGFTFNKFSNVATVSGNIVTTSGYFIGNGSQLQGLPAGYSNVQVATYLPTHTGNVAATYFIGNGALLTGIVSGGNNFGNIFIDGQSPVLADTPSDTLTIVGGTGIYITANAATDSVTFSLDQPGAFGSSGDFGTVDTAATVSEDEGSVADSAVLTYDLGSIVSATGLIYPDQLVVPIYTTASLPTATRAAAEVVYNSTTQTLNYSNGSNWQPVAAQSFAVAMSVALGS